MDFSKLFKLGDKNILEDVVEMSLIGKENEEIRKIILDNFWKLFPWLELYNEGKQSELPVFQANQKKRRSKSKKPDWVRKPDSLAFSEKEKTLYIFEYKSKMDENLLKQTQQYRTLLQSESILLNLILKWNKQSNKHRSLEDFKDNKARIICIAPEFDDQTIWTTEINPEEEIYLIKIIKLRTKEGSSFILLQSGDFEMISSSVIETSRERIELDLPRDKTKKDEVDDLIKTHPLLPISNNTELWVLKDSEEQVKKWVLELNDYIIKVSNSPYLRNKSWYSSLVYIWKSERVLVLMPRKISFTIYLQENEIITQDLDFKQSKRGWFVDKLIKRKTIKQEIEFYKTFELVKNYLKKVLV